MSKFRLKHNEWAVVHDGKKALILSNVGDDVFPQLKVLSEYEHEDRPTHELGTSAPARVHESVGPRRNTVEAPDLHDRSEQQFIGQLVQRLESAIREGKVTRLIVIAPPRALGVLRGIYSATLKAAIREEIAKDWVKLPVGEIEKRLAG